MNIDIAELEKISAKLAIKLWNECCSANEYYDDRIYDMGELDEYENGRTPLQIVEDCEDVDWRHDFFWSHNDNLKSGDMYEAVDACVDFGTLANYLENNSLLNKYLDDDEIAEVLIHAENLDEDEWDKVLWIYTYGDIAEAHGYELTKEDINTLKGMISEGDDEIEDLLKMCKAKEN